MRRILHIILIGFMFAMSLQAQTIIRNSRFFSISDSLGCDSMNVQFTLPVNSYSSVLWDFGNGTTSSATNPSVAFTTAGNYTVTVLINGDSLYIEDSLIQLRETPPPQFSNNDTNLIGSLRIEFVLTDFNPGIPGYTVNWDFGDGQSASLNDQLTANHDFAKEGTYIIQVRIDHLICQSTFQDTITIGSVFDVPNVFSPNDDGINDLFMVNSNGIDDITLEIFNRWGSPVYKHTSKTAFWDGYSNNGKPCQPGVYFYIIYSSNGQDQQEGSLHLYR